MTLSGDSEDRYSPRRVADDQEIRDWRERQAAIGSVVDGLSSQGICYQCEELSTGEILGEQAIITEDDLIRVVLASDPRTPGHTIIVWKPHAHDFSELDDDSTARLFITCRDVARALKNTLAGVERVYQVTMCDGPINHLHIQLIPRYAHTPIGSQRLVDPRGPLLDGDAIAERVRSALYAA